MPAAPTSLKRSATSRPVRQGNRGTNYTGPCRCETAVEPGVVTKEASRCANAPTPSRETDGSAANERAKNFDPRTAADEGKTRTDRCGPPWSVGTHYGCRPVAVAALEIGGNNGDKDIQHSASNGSYTNNIGTSSSVRAISFSANRCSATAE